MWKVLRGKREANSFSAFLVRFVSETSISPAAWGIPLGNPSWWSHSVVRWSRALCRNSSSRTVEFTSPCFPEHWGLWTRLCGYVSPEGLVEAELDPENPGGYWDISNSGTLVSLGRIPRWDPFTFLTSGSGFHKNSSCTSHISILWDACWCTSWAFLGQPCAF